MALITTNSLYGSIRDSKSLTGYNSDRQQKEVKRIKYKVLNDLLIPMTQNKWDKINENILIMTKYKKQTELFYDLYKTEDLLLLKTLFDTFELVLLEHKKILKYQEENSVNTEDDRNVATFFQHMTPLQLKPEYEIYKYILGKPDIKKNETYDKNILSDILKLLEKEEIEFSHIINFVKKKYRR